jgi:hypothetical protein
VTYQKKWFSLRKVNSIEQEMAHRGCKLFKYSPFFTRN